MEEVDYLEIARGRYTDLFQDDPIFDALVATLVEYKMKVQKEHIELADTILDIEKSVGANLDLIGSIVGQSRILVDYYSKPYFGFEGNPRAEPFDKGLWYSLFTSDSGDSRSLTDEEYRRVIKARILRNKTNGNRADFIAIMDLLLDIRRTNLGRNILPNGLFTEGYAASPNSTVAEFTQSNNPSYTNIVTKVQHKTGTSLPPYIGVRQPTANRVMEIVEGQTYTISFKAASSTGLMNYIYLLDSDPNTPNNLIDVGAISTDADNLTQVQHTFVAQVGSVGTDLLVGTRVNADGDWFVITDLQLFVGDTAPTEYEPVSGYPFYSIEEVSHGNITLNVGNATNGLAVHFLSNLDREDNIIPVPLGYRLQVKMV